MTGAKRFFIGAALLLAVLVLPAVSARADEFTYTFSGNGSGTVNGITFTNQDFSFVFTADTATIDGTAAPFFYLRNVGGTFTEGGSTETLNPTVTIAANQEFPTAPSTVGDVNFFNAAFTDGLGLFTSGLLGYDLSTAVGPVTGTANDTLGGGSFATTTGSVSITAEDSLTFTAAPVRAPEADTISMLLLGMLALGLGVGLQMRRGNALSAQA